jgi:valyl-tRNA synthetase
VEKTYSPESFEQTIYHQWENAGYFKPDGSRNDAYSMVIPPPNVTGTLHMGHGFQNAIMDSLTRYHRMKGCNTLWQPGMDHAGIATQMVVERQLLQEGKTRHDLGRERFIEKVWAWKETSGSTICQQIRRLGSSPDWSRERFMMDEELITTVRDVFIKLYDEGLIYRGKRLVNWDPKLGTAISDLEVNSEETQGHLWHIRYPLADGSGHLEVATTRPETMLGDTAVAVHPDDERYTHLIGTMVKLPLTDREIPVIADDYVDQTFGTGCVKITPAHDFNDYAMGKRHQLSMINILTLDGHINQDMPSAYQGLDCFQAREQIVKDLTALDLLVKTEDHTLKVPRGDRSSAIIEPMLTDQWFVKAAPLAEPAIKAVEKGEVSFVPNHWDKTYYQWMNNIEDWCISRQLWWGHRIPAWRDAEGNFYVAQDEQAARKKYKLGDALELTQDTDVLDTWFSAALWPFVTLGWPDDQTTLDTFFPTSVLVTGFDIIFFWVARMIMLSLKLTGKVPFKQVYITGLIRDHEGQKMSKSKGNVLDPIDLIDGIELDALVKKRTAGLMQPAMAKRVEKNTKKLYPDGIAAHGTDALRFTFCALASNNRDIRFDIQRLEGYRNFCNKLWNAARYVFMNVADSDLSIEQAYEYSLADEWIVSRLQKTIQKAHKYFNQYRFDFLAQTLYEFVWHEYCDWYLELSKTVLTDPTSTKAQKRGTKKTLVTVLEQLLKLLHPIMPFITETIWQNVKPILDLEGDTIMLQAYPEADTTLINENIESSISWLQELTTSLRTLRSEMNISPAKAIPAIFHKGDSKDRDNIKLCEAYLSSAAKLSSTQWHAEQEPLPASATVILNQLEVHIPMADLIDTQAELQRLDKEIEKITQEATNLNKRLNNKNFVEKAPKAIVEKEQARHQALVDKLEKTHSQRENIRQMVEKA